MVDSFSVQPETLRHAGAQMSVQAEELSAALGRLEGALSGLGDVCGDDQPGRSFAADYQPKAELLERALGRMVQALRDINGGLQLMASNYEGAEVASQVVGGPP